jgi:ceramide glucosyltransferase
MIHYTFRILELIAVGASLFSCIYYLLCLWSAAAFLRARKASAPAHSSQITPVSILKPLKGTDPEMYESFRSHCLQDYPEYEILFCVSEPEDPAVACVRQLQSEFPQSGIQLVIATHKLGENVKVSNLAQALPVAHYPILIVNDSDIRVERDYLRRVTAALCDEKTGLVTCLYRGVPAATLGSRLESLGISTDFAAGVLAARQMEGGIRFGLGSTLVFRRADLERIGGFEAVVDYLADDYELGKRIAALGLAVKISEMIVETHLSAYSLGEFLAHQLRWARGVRDSRPGGYLGLGLTFGLVWSCLAVLLARGAPWTWGLLALTAGLRLIVALLVGRTVLQDRSVVKFLWLLPVRDIVAFAVWIASFAGHTVTWRGDRFALKKGRMVRISSP